MFLSEMHQDEIADVKSFIGSFDLNKIVDDVKLGSPDKDRELHDWQYIAVKFTADASHIDVLKYIVRCQGDEFIGIFNGYHVLWFE